MERFRQLGMTEHKSVKWIGIVFSVVFAVFCYIGFIFFNPLYNSSDSIGVAIVVDGYYGANNYCQYIHPLLCLMIRFLTPLLPTGDVFTLLIHIVIEFQIGTLFLLFTEDILKNSIKNWTVYDIGRILAVGMSILLFTLGIKIWNSNYTITTGAITFFGLVICFISEKEKRAISWVIIGVATLCFGCMLRMESALLFLPFVILEMIVHCSVSLASSFNVKRNQKALGLIAQEPQVSNVLSIRCRLFPVAVLVFLLFITRIAFYMIEPYRTAARYNEARTICVDFPMSSWDSDLEREADGAFTANDYAAATEWCFIDTDFLDADMMDRIASTGRKNKYDINLFGLKVMLNEMRYTLFHSSLYMVILLFLSILLAIRNVICCNIWRWGETILALLGSFVIITYFTIRGRAPMRVWEPVIFATDFNLLMAFLDKQTIIWNLPGEQLSQSTLIGRSTPKIHMIVDHIFCLLMFIILWFSTGQLVAYASYHDPQPVWLSRIPAENSTYESTVSDFAEDALFIWPNWHAHIPEEVEKTGKLPSKEIIKHNIALGDWVYGQPYFTEFLKSIDAENPAAALLNRPNTFIMGGNGTAIRYLQEHIEGLADCKSNAGESSIEDINSFRQDDQDADEKKDIAFVFENTPELGKIDDLCVFKVKIDD